MDKVVKKIVPGSEVRYALMGNGYEPYRVAAIQSIFNSKNFLLILELSDDKQC